MSKYSIKDRIFIVKSWYSGGENPTSVSRKWSSEFKNREKPSSHTITNLKKKFEKLGSLLDDKGSMKTKVRTARTDENIATAKEILHDKPSTSMEQLRQEIGVSKSSAWRIARKDLGIYHYKIQAGQPLNEAAILKRLDFANEMLSLIDDGLDPNMIIFSDEAHFWLDGYVNRQNYRIWGSQKPELVVVRPLHPKKLTVWRRMCGEGLIGPYFFLKPLILKDIVRC